MDDLVRVTVVPNEVAADLVCSFLRAEGIKCAHRVTNVGAGSWDGVPNMGGAREIIVAAGRRRCGSGDPGGRRAGRLRGRGRPAGLIREAAVPG